MKKKGIKSFVSGKGFYVILSLCFVVIIVSAGIITINNANEINKQNEYAKQNEDYNYKNAEPVAANEVQTDTVDIMNEEDIQIGAGSEEDMEAYQPELISEDFQNTVENSISETEALVNETISQDLNTKPIEIVQNTEDNLELTQNSEPIVREVFSTFNNNSKFQWPVNGQIIMDYSVDHTIYDKTLEQYRINDSISIAAEVGTQVKAAATGTVVSITNDNQKGCTVVIDHGNGWQTTYSQLQKNVSVSENQIVETGDIIGGIENPTKYSIALGGHLDFEVKKDGETKDPKLLLESTKK